MKLTDDFLVVSDLDCDILLGVKAVSCCDLSVTKEGVKIKIIAMKENAKCETTVYFRYVKAVRNSGEI